MYVRRGIVSIIMASTTSSTLLPPRLLVQKEGSGDGIECSVHTLPKTLLREFQHVFRDTYLRRPEAADIHMETSGSDTTSLCQQQQLELLAIPTNQRAREDLVNIGDHIEKEKDRLLNVVRQNSTIQRLPGTQHHRTS